MPLIKGDRCPHCEAELPEEKPRVCPECGGSLQQRYLTAGCLSSAPKLLFFAAMLWTGCRSSGAPTAEGHLEAARSAYERRRDVPAARESLEAALAATTPGDPVRLEVLVGLARMRLRDGDPRGSAEAYELALAIAPDDPWLRTGYGEVLGTLGRDGEAEAAFTRALERDPNSVAALLERAGARERLGRAASAVADWERALAVLAAADPDDRGEEHAALLGLGRALEADGRPDEARAARRRADELRAAR